MDPSGVCPAEFENLGFSPDDDPLTMASVHLCSILLEWHPCIYLDLLQKIPVAPHGLVSPDFTYGIPQ